MGQVTKSSFRIVVAAIVAALGVGLAVWFLAGARDERAANGTELGTLPDGVRTNRLNLVIVTLDTTRADHMGAYGAKDVETPVFDRLASEGVLFEQAVAVAPLTLPAHSSLFTGKFPPEHGVRDNGGFFLGPDQVTLAEVLKGRGYKTGAFVAAYVLVLAFPTGRLTERVDRVLARAIVGVAAVLFLPTAARLDRTRDGDVPPTGLPDPNDEPRSVGH